MLVIESSRFASVRSIFQNFHVDSHFQIYIQGSVSSTQIFHWRGFKFYYFSHGETTLVGNKYTNEFETEDSAKDDFRHGSK